MRLTGLLFILPLLTAACGDSGTTSTSTGSGGSGGSVTTASTTSSASTGAGGSDSCATGHLCMEVKAVGKQGSGRLGLVWFQLNDDAPTPDPLIAYDVPFSAATTSVDIDLSAVTAVNDPNLLCPRSCADEATCACTGDPQVGLGLVVVVDDTNGNGKIDVAELDDSNFIGVSQFVVVSSKKALATVPAPYDTLFPQGIVAGVLPYDVIKNESAHDQLKPSSASDTFVLEAGDGDLDEPNLE